MANKKESTPKIPCKHLCELSLDYRLDAEVSCEEDEEGRFFLQRDIRYQVNHCPVCGEKAPTQLEEELAHTRESVINGVCTMDDLISDCIEHEPEDEKALESMGTRQLHTLFKAKGVRLESLIDEHRKQNLP